MARFVFSLQAVLEHRVRLEEEAQKRAATIKARLDDCQAAIARLEGARREAAGEMHQRLAQGMPDRERLLYANYLESAAAQQERLAGQEKRIQTELAAARRLLVEAMRRRKVIEEVRKTEHAEFLRAELLEENKLYDDLGRRAWIQNRKENLAFGGKD